MNTVFVMTSALSLKILVEYISEHITIIALTDINNVHYIVTYAGENLVVAYALNPQNENGKFTYGEISINWALSNLKKLDKRRLANSIEALIIILTIADAWENVPKKINQISVR